MLISARRRQGSEFHEWIRLFMDGEARVGRRIASSSAKRSRMKPENGSRPDKARFREPVADGKRVLDERVVAEQ